MQTEIIIAGFGGQGVLFAGQLLAYAAMDNGLEVTWIPSYGPEMRGGTANCTVIIADEEIGSPIVRNPQVALVLNRPSLDKYEPLVKPGGLLVVNASLVDRNVDRRDIRTVLVPANEIAEHLGDRRVANMVMLGAMLSNQPILTLDAVVKAMEAHLLSRHRNLLPLNVAALQEGAKYLAEQLQSV
ncbi:2-oxoacid:acceptor oxidoreductase family protein [Thermanaerothrix sp. 4228-RoL]|jgi:2-oxoglutarate ferredoxin oxidoreductase subunit gamma|uniref:2-oxoacid:acceptor oxidoreductase family protein n=1 Tax=Thermanaerothrix solaris TaxID=3058434 RepID=A0ABU3NNZ4_9CHLR|nr:2-oxoacid:acceptor oxidoreductase family protein [Thermanaerothrix sp. 4228-RoL]MDT8898559.1 2-oxoacid:acceptor oxidoreductase family protein [Thermanaerothrix sp. 4228-RoL]